MLKKVLSNVENTVRTSNVSEPIAIDILDVIAESKREYDQISKKTASNETEKLAQAEEKLALANKLAWEFARIAILNDYEKSEWLGEMKMAFNLCEEHGWDKERFSSLSDFLRKEIPHHQNIGDGFPLTQNFCQEIDVPFQPLLDSLKELEISKEVEVLLFVEAVIDRLWGAESSLFRVLN